MFVFSTTSFLIPVLWALQSRVVEMSTKGSSSEFSEDTQNSRQSRGNTLRINGFHVRLSHFFVDFVGTPAGSKVVDQSRFVAMGTGIPCSLSRFRA